MPDTILNMFSADDPAFSNITLSNLVNQNFPYVPGFLSDLHLTGDGQGMTTLSMAFEEANAGIRMISASPRGAPPSQIAHVKGRMRSLPAYHFAREVTVNADELLGVRARGSMNPQTLQNLLTERTDGPVGVKMQLALTREHWLLGLVQGKVYDADGTTVLWDYFDWSDTVPSAPVPLAISTQSANTSYFMQFALNVKRKIMQALNGFPVPNSAVIIVLCDDSMFDAIATSAELRDARKAGAFGSTDAAAIISMASPYTFIEYAGLRWVNYRSTADGLVAIPPGQGIAFMAGVPGLFQEWYAPADTFEDVTALGLPYYLLNDPNNKNTAKRAVFELQSNPLFANLRPAASIPVTKT